LDLEDEEIALAATSRRQPEQSMIDSRSDVAVDAHTMMDLRRIAKKIFSISVSPLAVIVLFSILAHEKFLSANNLFIVFQQSIAPCFSVWGICFVMIMGSYDMTPGVTIIVASMIGTVLSVQYGYIGLIVGGIVAGVLIGVLNGIVFTRLRIPSVISTVGLVMVYEVVASMVSKGKGLYLPDQYGELSHFPYNTIFFVIGFFIAYVLYSNTRIGLHIQAMGHSEKIAKDIGINIPKTKFLAYVICAIFGGLGGILYQSYGRFVQPQLGLTSLVLIFPPLCGFFFALALSKWINLILAVVVGQFTINLLLNGLIIVGFPTPMQQIVLGIVLISVVAIGSINKEGIVK
jgi:ribose transport system permease protein